MKRARIGSDRSSAPAGQRTITDDEIAIAGQHKSLLHTQKQLQLSSPLEQSGTIALKTDNRLCESSGVKFAIGVSLPAIGGSCEMCHIPYSFHGRHRIRAKGTLSPFSVHRHSIHCRHSAAGAGQSRANGIGAIDNGTERSGANRRHPPPLCDGFFCHYCIRAGRTIAWRGLFALHRTMAQGPNESALSNRIISDSCRTTKLHGRAATDTAPSEPSDDLIGHCSGNGSGGGCCRRPIQNAVRATQPTSKASKGQWRS